MKKAALIIQAVIVSFFSHSVLSDNLWYAGNSEVTLWGGSSSDAAHNFCDWMVQTGWGTTYDDLHALTEITERKQLWWCSYDVGIGSTFNSAFYSYDSQSTACIPPQILNIETGECYTGCQYGNAYNSPTDTCIDWPTDAPNNGAKQCPLQAGNPINVAQGNKYQKETDYVGVGEHPLKFVRHYNSQDTLITAARMGSKWRHTYEKTINVINSNEVIVQRSDGQRLRWTVITGNVLESINDDAGAQLHRTNDGWEYITTNGVSEKYDILGQLKQIEYPNEHIIELEYDSSKRLQTVSDSVGQTLTFDYYSDGRLYTVTTSGGRVFQYGYNDPHGNLTSVTYPGAASPTRVYHYEASQLPNALTGITDENGNRYATFEYDTQGRAIASYHGPQTAVLTDRIDGVSIVYNPEDTRTVTDSRGNSTTYHTTTQLGLALATQIDGPGCSSCGGANTAYTYDAENNLLSKVDNGTITRYGNYDSKGNYQCMVEGINATDSTPLDDETCGFDPAASPDARRIDYTYDPRFPRKVATIARPSIFSGAQKVTTYTYDDFGNRTSVRIDGYQPDGTAVLRETTYQYQGPLNQLSQIDGPRTDVADITTYRHYPDDPAEGNNRARLKEIEDANGTLIRGNLQYTATGKVDSESRPNGLSLHYTYYAGSDRLETLTEYLASGGIRKTKWTYLNTGEVESVTTGYETVDAVTLTFQYDDARRLVSITDGLGNSIRYTLDTEGNRLREETWDHGNPSAMQKLIVRVFDIYNRLDSITDYGGTQEIDYAADGTLDRETDGTGVITDYNYDDLKRLNSTIQDKNGTDPQTNDTTTGYGYDAGDNLTTVIDARGNPTQYEYDDLGNQLSVSSPDTGLTLYSYDAAGNLQAKEDEREQLFIYTYDALNRVTSLTTADPAHDISYTYDSCPYGEGLLCSVDRNGKVIAYTYKSDGQIASMALTVSNTDMTGTTATVDAVNYEYDTTGRVSRMTYPSGATLDYQRDSAGNVTDVTYTYAGNATALLSGGLYYPFGPMKGGSLGNGWTIANLYDPAYRPYQIDSGAYAELISEYDANGNPKQIVVAQGNRSYAYDALDRVMSELGIYWNFDWTYDRLGNRLSETFESLTSGYGFTSNYGYESGSNRLTLINAFTISNDANGNRSNLLQAYMYTPDNRLRFAVSGESPNNTIVGSYHYDGLGRRVLKGTLMPGNAGALGLYRGKAFLHGPDGNLLAELGPTGEPIREYFYLDDQPLAAVDYAATSGELFLRADLDKDNLITAQDALAWYYNHYAGVMDPAYEVTGDGIMDTDDYTVIHNCLSNGDCEAAAITPRIHYIHNDRLGAPQALTDSTGNIVWKGVYSPFGYVYADENPDGDQKLVEFNLRFPGQYFDKESGLHYNYFRTYDPSTGRYLESDPIGLAGGLNTYAYVGGNPLRFSDSKGLAYNLAARFGWTIGTGIDAGVKALTGTALSSMLGAAAWDLMHNDNVIGPGDAWPGSREKESERDQCPTPDPDDPCDRVRDALENMYTELATNFLSARGNDVARQKWRRKASFFEESVDEYNSSCTPRWPDYKRFNLAPGADPFILY